MFTRFTSLILVACAALGGGCQSPRHYLADDVDLSLDFTPLDGESDRMHSPYVTGARFNIFARSTDDEEPRASWIIESSDPNVLRVGTTMLGDTEAVAVGPGSAIVTVRDGMNVLIDEEIEVRVPASADLLWHGTLLLHRPEDEAVVDDARIVTGGAATFLVRWRDDRGHRLHGNGALEVTTEAGMTGMVEQSFLFEDRDWLMLIPEADGLHPIEISAGGHRVGSFSATAVAPEAVDHIVLEGESEMGQGEGACLVVLAVAEDVDGQRIFGAGYEWDVDGESLRDYGDVLHYSYDPNLGVTVGASYGDARTETTVHASGGFYVTTSNAVGCSAGGAGAGIPLSMAAPLALAGLFLIRRRRGLR